MFKNVCCLEKQQLGFM